MSNKKPEHLSAGGLDINYKIFWLKVYSAYGPNTTTK